jgi:hypothetical protein
MNYSGWAATDQAPLRTDLLAAINQDDIASFLGTALGSFLVKKKIYM